MKSIDGIKSIKRRGKNGRFIKKTAWISFARKIAKSSALVVLSLIIILSQSSIFSAFEAHVINVTATIENRPPEDMGKFPPIADACVTQAECTSSENNGARRALKIISKKGGNARAFIRFDFHFPPGTTVQSALLKLFMHKAPDASREYEARRVLERWKERDPSGVTWDNQPNVDTEITSMILSGTAPGWLSWNVASDTQSFIDGDFLNYGWRLGDSQENSKTRYLAKLRSRESGKTAQRPVLEIAFTNPAATTTYPVINEVYSDVENDKGQERKNEWVEIYNPTSSAVNISGWKICATGGCDIIPSSSPVPSHGFAVVSPESATWGFWPGIPAGAIKIVLGSKFGSDGLDNPGDRVILRNASNAVVDAMSYGSDKSQLNPSVHVSSKGNSMARIVKGYDTNSAWDWITNITPNPGTNPSSGGAEVIRFTADGIEVAGLEQGLEPLVDNGDYIDEEKEEYIEPAPEEATIAPAIELQSEPIIIIEEIETATENNGEIATTTPENINTEEIIPEPNNETLETNEEPIEELIISPEEPADTQEESTSPPEEAAAEQTSTDASDVQSEEQNSNTAPTETQDSNSGGGNMESQAESAAIKENDSPPAEAVSQDNPDQ